MLQWIAVIACSIAVAGAQWQQFRGPNGSGVAGSAKPPVAFSPKEGSAWKTPLLPGPSSPVISGDLIFLTAADKKLYTICLDRKSGKILWQVEAARPRVENFQPTNSPASPSPVTDGKSVYVFFGDFGLISYDLKGKEQWQLPLGPFNNANDHGSSPILVDDLVVLLCDQDTNSYMLAVSKTAGKVVWKVERPEVTRSYSTPAVVKRDGRAAELTRISHE